MKKLIALLLAVTMVFGLAGAAAAETAEVEATYTYNDATGIFPTNWSPFSESTTVDGTLMGYMSVGFFEYDYNETGDGWALVPRAAVDYPEDVTADYVG